MSPFSQLIFVVGVTFVRRIRGGLALFSWLRLCVWKERWDGRRTGGMGSGGSEPKQLNAQGGFLYVHLHE